MPTSDRHRKAESEIVDGARLADRSTDGVDLTLIRWMLTLNHTERLQALQRAVCSLDELRHGDRS